MLRDRTVNSFLLSIAAFFILLLGAAYVAPNYIEWNDYKDVFEEQASRIVGREVRIDGDIDVKILPSPYVKLSNVKIADSPRSLIKSTGFQRKRLFAQLESFKLLLSIPPLLRGIVKVKEIELDKPNFYIRLGKGKSNLNNLGEGNLALPFVPREISIDSFNVQNGTFNIFGAPNEAPVVLSEVVGALSAETLQGPYKFTGQFQHQGTVRKLTLATGEPNRQGSMRVKSIMEVANSGSKYIVDGEIHGLGTIPKLKGKLTGQIPINLLGKINDGNAARIDGSEKRVIDVRADMSAGLKRLELQNLTVAIEDDKRPQSINGLAIFDWNKGVNLKAQLKATWVDFDQMLAPDQSVAEFTQNTSQQAVGKAFDLLTSGIQNVGRFVDRAIIHTRITDAKLGGSRLNNFELLLNKDFEKFKIAKFAVQLPGRNRLKLSGSIVKNKNKLTFNGPVSIKGISLGALSHWAFIDKKSKTVFQSNPYFLAGNVNFSPGRFEIKQLKGDLNGSGIKGSFIYDFQKRKKFIIELDSDNVDLRDVVAPNATLRSLIAGLNNGKDSKDVKIALDQLKNNQKQDTNIVESFVNEFSEIDGRINIRIGRIRLPKISASDVFARGRVLNGRLELRSFELTADGGLKIAGRGQINDLQSEPEGNLRFSVNAENASGLKKLLEQLEAPASATNNNRFLNDLSPLRLAITLNMQSGGLPSTDIIIAGSLAQSQLSLSANHKGIISTLGSKQLNLNGSLINAKASNLIRQLISSNKIKVSEAGQGSFNIRVNGIPQKGLQTSAHLNAGSTQIKFDGKLRQKSSKLSGRGSIIVQSANAAAGLSLIGLDGVSGFQNQNMKLSANLSKTQDVYQVSKLRGRVGKLTLSGNGLVDLSAKPNIEINGFASEGDFSSLLTYLIPSLGASDLEKAIKSKTDAVSVVQTNWSNKPFTLGNLKTYIGKVDLKFRDLKLNDNLKLSNAKVEAQLDKEGLQINRVSGKLYNGRFSASAQLNANEGPLKMEAAMSLRDADLAEVVKSTNGRAVARGSADLLLSVSGEGLSPLGLISELRGKGRLRIKEGEIFNFSPNAVPRLVTSSNAKDKKQLANEFLGLLEGQGFPLRNVRAPIIIQTGTVKINNIGFTAGQTEANANAFVELASLKLDSEWQLKSRSQKNLPGVRLVFAGPLSKMSLIRPIVDTSDLNRSLAVNKIERDFDTLKKLESRDPETIRRFQNGSGSDQFVTSPGNGQLSGLQNKNDIQRKGYNTQEKSLPSLTNLGVIDKPEGANNPGLETTQDIGTQYNYTQDTPELTTENTPEEGSQEKTQPKKKKKKSIFDLLFDSDTSGDG